MYSIRNRENKNRKSALFFLEYLPMVFIILRNSINVKPGSQWPEAQAGVFRLTVRKFLIILAALQADFFEGLSIMDNLAENLFFRLLG